MIRQSTSDNMKALREFCLFTLLLHASAKRPTSEPALRTRPRTEAGPRMSFTNFQCQSLSKQFVEVEVCRLRAVQRNLREISLKLKVLQPPVDNVTARMQFMKKSNGYKPYIFDITFDGCGFMRAQNNALLKYLYEILKPYTNVNHTCPMNEEEIIVEGLRVDPDVLRHVGIIPSGDYAFFTTWMTNKIKRLYLQLYLRYDEN